MIIAGDALECLRLMPDECAHCCVTSPPYYGLRDYGVVGQIGLEPTPKAYVARMVEVFREVRRVLRNDGTFWLNMGDSYAGRWATRRNEGRAGLEERGRERTKWTDTSLAREGLKDKDLMGIPWMLAFALRADGWYLRRDIIWAKPNPMPEPVRDRCATSHEYIFLLSKSASYYYDNEAIKEPQAGQPHAPGNKGTAKIGNNTRLGGHLEPDRVWGADGLRNKRSVWTVTTKPYKGAHFATFPPDLIEPCILAGTSERGVCPKCAAPWERVPTQRTIGWHPTCSCCAGHPVPATVLDPFSGAGTTGLVADRLGRDCIGIELNPAYALMAHRRIEAARPIKEAA